MAKRHYGMKYYRDYKINYRDLDDTMHLRLVALEEYLLETAGSVADYLGFGVHALHQRGYTWVVTTFAIEVSSLPTIGDKLHVETWIESLTHGLSVRNFRLFVGNEQIGQARSVWTVIDLTKRELASIFADPIFDGCVDGEPLPISRAQRVKGLLEGTQQPYTIRYSDLDYNKHCNSCKYLQMMLDAARPDLTNFYAGNQRLRLDIQYLREVHLNEKVTLIFNTEQNYQYQLLTPDGLLSCSAIITIE